MMQQQTSYPAVQYPTLVPNRPDFQYGSAPDGQGQWWITVGCRRCGDYAQKPCAQPARTGYWVVVYIQTHVCR
jgi:hypothetical protein